MPSRWNDFSAYVAVANDMHWHQSLNPQRVHVSLWYMYLGLKRLPYCDVGTYVSAIMVPGPFGYGDGDGFGSSICPHRARKPQVPTRSVSLALHRKEWQHGVLGVVQTLSHVDTLGCLLEFL